MTNTYLPAGRVAVGHPVDIASGAVFTAWHDFELPGTIPLVWRRHYATNSEADTILGRRWTTPFFVTLTIGERVAVFTDEDGISISFDLPEQPLPIGGFVRNLFVNMELWRTEIGYRVTHWHHDSTDQQIFQFAQTNGDTAYLVAIENAAGHRLSITYDGRGRPNTIVQELEQRRLELEFGSEGLLTAVLFIADDGVARPLVTYQYDAAHALVGAVNAVGGAVAYAYDDLGRMTREQNPLGSAFHFKYDVGGRCIAASGDRQFTYRRLSYDASGRAVHVTDSQGNTTHYYLSVAGQVIQRVNPTGAPYTWEYDEFGRITHSIKPDGTKKVYEYDASGNRTRIVLEDGSMNIMQYDENHALLAYTNANGSTWTFSLNKHGQLMAVTNPLGKTFTYKRDSRQLVIESRTPEGRSNRSIFDHRLRWWELRDEVSLLSRVEYDDRGNPIATYNEAGCTGNIDYDMLGRAVQRQDALGNRWIWRWNALGRLTGYIQPGGREEAYEYDAFGHMVALRDGLGETRLAYDTEGRLITVINCRGEKLERTYDADGRLHVERTFDGREETREYNLRGELHRITRSDGAVVEFSYDAVGNVLRRTSTDGLTKVYQYDLCGRLLSATTGETEFACEYDLAGRLITEVQNGHLIRHQYDADNFGILTQILGNEIHKSFDQRGRLSQIGDSAGQMQALLWDNVNQLIERRTPEGMRERRTYRRDNRLLAQEVFGPGGNVRLRRMYDRDPIGNVLRCEDSRSGESRFAYDDFDRLTEVQGPAGYRGFFRYDALGCITESHRGPRASGPNGRTEQEGSTNYHYDAAGCLASVVTADGGKTEYSYSTDGQLVRVQMPDGTVAEYTYDAFGRRCRRKVGDEITEYLWHGYVLAAEKKDRNRTRIFFSHGFELVAEWDCGNRRFPILDPSGAVREVLDDQAAIVWSCILEPYGLTTDESGPSADRQRMRGQYSDSVTGMHDNIYRTYHPGLGSYISPDPIGLAGGSDYYGYPRNPLRWNDPLGLNCRPDHEGEAEGEQQPKLMYHYTDQDESKFANGLWRGTSVTDKLYTDPFEASQALGIPVPDKVIPIVDTGQFVPNKPPIVQPSNCYVGGGTDFVNPQPVPAADLLPAMKI